MSNTINPRPLEPLLQELQEKGFSYAAVIAFRDMFTRMDKVLTNLGEVQPSAPVKGRTEGLGITVTNLNSTGQLKTADNIAADGATFGRVNVVALTSNNVDLAKAGVVNKTAANIAETSNLKWRQMAHSTTQPTGLTITASDAGASATATFSAFTQQVPGLTSYGIALTFFAGLAYSTTYYCYMNDPNFNGVAASINITTDPNVIFGNSANTYIGTIKTPPGGGGPTTGVTGGTGGARNINTVLA